MNNIELWNYKDEVLDYLTYIGIEEYVEGFAAEDIATDLKKYIIAGFSYGMSPRKTAIVFWSYTINYQVKRVMEKMKSKNQVN